MHDDAKIAGRGRLLTPDEVADHLRIDREKLSKLRIAGTGPAYVKIGREIRYHPRALLEYIDACTRTGTGEADRAR